MKKRIIFIAVLVLSFMPALALAFENPALVDEAGYLTEEQAAEISDKLNKLRTEYDFDTAVYIEKAMSGVDAQNTADDIFDDKSYGGGSGKDGIMLYISEEPRKYHYTTHGTGITRFNDSALEYVDDAVLPYLQDDDYYSALITYADTAQEVLEATAQGEPFEYPTSIIYIICVVAAGLLIPLVIASAAMHIKLARMKTAVGNDYAENYVKPGSMHLSQSSDIYLYSNVTKTPIPKETSDSGTHVSSSGETHGGRGGSY